MRPDRPSPRSPDEGPVRDDTPLSPARLRKLRERLLEERTRILGRMRRNVDTAIDQDAPPADELDVATIAQDQALYLRLADKDRKLLVEIEHALAKFALGTYGQCEGTGEPIGWRRLWARPWTRYSVAYKEQLEAEARQGLHG